VLAEHDWILVETGYEHYWSVEVKPDGSIVASNERQGLTGNQDDFLWCRSCGSTQELDGVEVDFE